MDTDGEMLNCGICTLEYKEPNSIPKVLKCGHTLCLVCLKRVWETGCPTCRAPITREEFNATPTNYALLEVVGKGLCASKSPELVTILESVNSTLANLKESRTKYGGLLPKQQEKLAILDTQIKELEQLHAHSLHLCSLWKPSNTVRGTVFNARLTKEIAEKISDILHSKPFVHGILGDKFPKVFDAIRSYAGHKNGYSLIERVDMKVFVGPKKKEMPGSVTESVCKFEDLVPHADSVYVKLEGLEKMVIQLNMEHPQTESFLKMFTGNTSQNLIGTKVHSFKRRMREGECFSIGSVTGLFDDNKWDEGDDIKRGAVVVPKNLDPENMEVAIFVTSWPTRRSTNIIGYITDGSAYLSLVKPSMVVHDWFAVQDIGIVVDMSQKYERSPKKAEPKVDQIPKAAKKKKRRKNKK